MLAACGITQTVFIGCGSESEEIVEGTPDSGVDSSLDHSSVDSQSTKDAFLDAILDGRRADTADCKLVAQTCTKSTDCCSANCNTTTSTCDAPVSSCSAPATACNTGPDCCTFSCIGGSCAAKLCVADNLACATNEECCGGSCVPDGAGGGKCAPLNGTGPATSGNPCTLSTDCASKFCNNGICTNPSFCVQQGDICSSNFDCCGGVCTIAGGATVGTCAAPASAPGVPGCAPSGTICGAPVGADAGGPSCTSTCCSRSCGPYGSTNIPVCQPASGCHPTGEVCRTHSDCCGWSGSADAGLQVDGPVSCAKASPTQEFGRCNNGGSCREPGSICKPAGYQCSAENNCCEDLTSLPSSYCNSNPENCCRRDALGIPRCLVKPNDCSAPVAAGTVCATSADCCGKPCVDNQCVGECVPNAGACTTTADCCAGLPCVVPAGSGKGICGGTLLPDGGVAPTDGGVITDDGGAGADGGAGTDGGQCAFFGQACNVSEDCCNSVPCTNGSCRYP